MSFFIESVIDIKLSNKPKTQKDHDRFQIKLAKDGIYYLGKAEDTKKLTLDELKTVYEMLGKHISSLES